MRPGDVAANGVAWATGKLVIAISYRDGVMYSPDAGVTEQLAASRSNTVWPTVTFDDHVFYGDIRLNPTTGERLTDVAYPFPDCEFPVTLALDQGVFIWGGSACPRTADRQWIGEDIGLIWTGPLDRTDTYAEPEPFEARVSIICGGGSETLTIYDHFGRVLER